MEFVSIKVNCPVILKDFLISELFALGFDSFQELDDGFEGSCPAENFSETEIEELLKDHQQVSYSILRQEKINWNKEWEKNYDPITVGDRCIVRASFHKERPEFEYEIIITPKMSFGTGHHATTHQILAYQLKLDHQGKSVLDVGTGTGVLAIMARKRGANRIVATDIDDWCIENSSENFTLNAIKDYQIHQVQIEELADDNFDIIIANINRNVLLDQIVQYAKRLKEQGELILSGFYQGDSVDLITEASKYSLIKKTDSVKDNWAMLVFKKQSV